LSKSFPSGSTLVEQNGLIIFTDKHGTKVTFLSNGSKVEYGDGRVNNFYNGFTLNNFGYAIKFQRNNSNPAITVDTNQSINLSIDHCDVTSQTCGALSQQRSSKIEYTADGRTITDTFGGQTIYKFQNYVALKYRAPCNPNCLAPLEYRSYPTSIRYPGYNYDNLQISYSQNIPYLGSSLIHDDIKVSSIIKNGVTAQYAQNVWVVNSSGATIAKPPSFLRISLKVAGQEISYSEAYRPFGEWGVGRPAILHTKDALGRITYYGFNKNMELSGVTKPDKGTISNIYGIRENIVESQQIPKPNSGLATIKTTFAYVDACTPENQMWCNKPISVTDTQGNKTEYTYNSRGQVLTETLPPPSAGAIRPKTTNTYTMLTAKIKNASGAMIDAGPPISMLTKVSTCRSQATCEGTEGELVKEFQYNHNNLHLTAEIVRNGNSTLVSTTTYEYDYFGNVTRIDGPLTSLDDNTYMSYDNANRKIFDIKPDPDGTGPLKRSIIKHSYDARGNEVLVQEGIGSATNGSDFVPKKFVRKTYDQSNQLIKSEAGTY
jgi:YD repeat-containing protein